MTRALAMLCLLIACSDSPQPESPPTDPPPEAARENADPGYAPPCLSLEMSERGAESIPSILLQLGDEVHRDSTPEFFFAREGTVDPTTAAGHRPEGHVFRWTLREVIAEPRREFSNTEFRRRMTALSRGAPVQEGFSSPLFPPSPEAAPDQPNQPIRTFEARLRTQTQRELVLSAVNSAQQEPSLVALTCVDHGALPELSVDHFHRWGLLPRSLEPVVELAGSARVRSLSSAPVELVVAYDDALEGVESPRFTVSRLDNGALRITSSD